VDRAGVSEGRPGMSDEPVLSPGPDRYLCELRDHGPYGVEAQFYQNEELLYSRRFDPRLDPTRPPRAMAIAWAEGERTAIAGEDMYLRPRGQRVRGLWGRSRSWWQVLRISLHCGSRRRWSRPPRRQKRGPDPTPCHLVRVTIGGCTDRAQSRAPATGRGPWLDCRTRGRKKGLKSSHEYQQDAIAKGGS
jgi:hypothetical protein